MIELTDLFIEVYGDPISLYVLGYEWGVFLPVSASLTKQNRAIIKHPFTKDFIRSGSALAEEIGYHIKNRGNIVHRLDGYLNTFPTKYNHWEKPDLEIIKESCRQAVRIANANEEEPFKFLLPKPGVERGGLNWTKEVKPAIKDILDDRFYVFDHKGK